MLESFQLAAIATGASALRLFHIPLHQSLQIAVAKVWEEQLGTFTSNIERIPFNPGYSPEDHERFFVQEYVLPQWLEGTHCGNAERLDPITRNENLLPSICGIVAFTRRAKNDELILFQNFSRSHVIQPGRFLFLDDGVYTTSPKRALTLGGKLSAIYSVADRELLFHNFRTANTFLPLSEFFEEATEVEIREVLAHPLISAEDTEVSAAQASQWTRKRFSMLRASGVLEKHTAQDIKRRAEPYDVAIQLDGDKIIFPKDKVASKKLLQFLNEEIFRGPITETLYETNSKREAD